MERIEVITSVQRCRRYTGQEKAQFVAMTCSLDHLFLPLLDSMELLQVYCLNGRNLCKMVE